MDLTNHIAPEQKQALSASQVREAGDKACAAIASEMAGQLYGLKVLDRNVMNHRGNTTRFIVVASRKLYEASSNKISICFETRHENAALYNMLWILRETWGTRE